MKRLIAVILLVIAGCYSPPGGITSRTGVVVGVRENYAIVDCGGVRYFAYLYTGKAVRVPCIVGDQVYIEWDGHVEYDVKSIRTKE